MRLVWERRVIYNPLNNSLGAFPFLFFLVTYSNFPFKRLHSMLDVYGISHKLPFKFFFECSMYNMDFFINLQVLRNIKKKSIQSCSFFSVILILKHQKLWYDIRSVHFVIYKKIIVTSSLTFTCIP